MAIKIEKLTPQRVDEAMAVYHTLLGSHEHTTPQALLDRLDSGQGIFYIAVEEVSNQVVGLKFGYLEGNTCIGRGIALLPAYRRQGIASALLRHFEADLRAHPHVHQYAFGSATTEGIPFHLASGYTPVVLIQFADKNLRQALDLSEFKITSDGYNDTYQVYQIYLELAAPARNLATLRQLQSRYPMADVQFVFSKTF